MPTEHVVLSSLICGPGGLQYRSCYPSDMSRTWVHHLKKFMGSAQLVLALHAVLLVSLESSLWAKGASTWFETHLELWCGRYWLLNHFSQWQLNKNRNWKLCIGIWVSSWCCWKALVESDLIDFFFTILRAKFVCKIFDFGVDFVTGNSKKLQKLGLEGKIS